LLPVEVCLGGLRIERRSVMEFDAGPELEGPGLEVIGMAPRLGELWRRLALVVERRQCVEDGGSRGFRRRVEHADLQRIETGNVELEADGDAAARLLRGGRACPCRDCK